MNEIDIDNAIRTLKILCFFECAKKQKYTHTFLENIIIKKYRITRQKAQELIYSVAPRYSSIAKEKDCVEYLIESIDAQIPIR